MADQFTGLKADPQLDDSGYTRRQPLEGIRVLDLTLAMAGPLTTQRLADMGAEVIKIEGPSRPDFTRDAAILDVRLGGETIPYLSLNRNKKSLALDLKSPDGIAVMHRLVASADVVVQNMRPGVAERLGISFDALKAVNPKIVYVSISGYGDSGPMVARPGQDLLVQSFSGTTFNAGTDERPHPSPIYLVDVAASHNACEAVLAGLIQRDRDGQAVEAKVTLLQAVLEIQIQELTTFLTTGKYALRGQSPSASVWMEPPYGIYKVRDGYLAIAQSSLKVLSETLDVPKIAELNDNKPDGELEPEMVAWRDAVYDEVQRALIGRDLEPTIDLLTAAGIWCGPVLDYNGLMAHPQSQGLFSHYDHPIAGRIDTLAPVINFTTSPPAPLRHAPSLGEHSAEILGEIGFAKHEIASLQAQGVVI
ncbi:CaiB/BaiF CoA-transferase family protein [Asticcacaulis sp. 201]|uniref:CaiB/BaiF CoA transferase family protein n=1 Tax=Asticcacaulis sp. 201 TaxID=3028787 RepID=UPI002915CA29|nr:CaiB/BaiF CoA-transferase family protein [Asticcacaulis sp. 201]MDV6330677.1 CaiB/BaiF CoA-transferase family protein [Asticcacaulis sp. 201]